MTCLRLLFCWLLVPALGFHAFPAAPAATEGAQIRGVLLDQNGFPAVGYQVGLKTKGGDLTLSAPTGADGSFVLESLPPDTYRLVAFGPDGAEFPVLSREVALKPGQLERLEIRISGKGGVPGKGGAAETKAAAKSAGKGLRGWVAGSAAGKVAVVLGGAFAVGALASAASSGGDENNSGPPPSPSRI